MDRNGAAIADGTIRSTSWRLTAAAPPAWKEKTVTAVPHAHWPIAEPAKASCSRRMSGLASDPRIASNAAGTAAILPRPTARCEPTSAAAARARSPPGDVGGGQLRGRAGVPQLVAGGPGILAMGATALGERGEVALLRTVVDAHADTDPASLDAASARPS